MGHSPTWGKNGDEMGSGVIFPFLALFGSIFFLFWAVGPTGQFLPIFGLSVRFPFLTFFLRTRKKGFSFFSCGATPSRTAPKTQPLQVAFSLRERVELKSQKEGIFGKRTAWGRVGQTGQKKEKRMHKKGGILHQAT